MKLAPLETLSLETPVPHVLVVPLNRPQVANAMNTQMGCDLHAFWSGRSRMPGDIRCVVFDRAGERAFCAGGDLKERNGMTDAAVAAPAPDLRAASARMHRLPGADHRRGQRRRLCRRHGNGAVLRLRLCRRDRALRADRGDARHHAGRRRHAEPAARGRRAPRQGDHPDRQAVHRRSRRSNGAWSTGSARRTAARRGAGNRRRIAGNAPISVRQAKQSIHYGLQMDLAQRHDVRDRGLQPHGPDRGPPRRHPRFNEKRKPVFKGK